MFQILLGLVSGPLREISRDLKDAYQAKLDAKNDAERIAADERLAILEARKTTILAAQSSPAERWVRPAIAFPFVLYINKLVIWDKLLGYGVTDNLSAELWQILWIVLGSYFVDAGIKKWKGL